MTFETQHEHEKDTLLTRTTKLHFDEETYIGHREYLLAEELAKRGITIEPEILETVLNNLDMKLREPVDFIFRTDTGNVIYSSVGPGRQLDKEARIKYEEGRMKGDLPEHAVVIRDIHRLHKAYIDLKAWSESQTEKNDWLKYIFYDSLLKVASKDDLKHPELFLEKMLTRLKNGHLFSGSSEIGHITTKDGTLEALTVSSECCTSGNETPFKLSFQTLDQTRGNAERLPSVYYAIDQAVTTDTDSISQISIFAIQDEPIEDHMTQKQLDIFKKIGLDSLIANEDEGILKELESRSDVSPFKTVEEIDKLLEKYKLVEKAGLSSTQFTQQLI